MTNKLKILEYAAGIILIILIISFFVWYQPVTGTTVSVLFIGNSFTSVNDLPKTVSEIAKSLRDRVNYDSYTPGGYKLSDHIKDQQALHKIQAQPWDYVVLQEQSQLPSFITSQVNQETTPFVVGLDKLIHQNHSATKTVLYETWGYQDGDSQNCPVVPGVCDYQGMQARLTQAYQSLAAQISADLAPVGEAWATVRATHPEIQLYQSDGKHPSEAGTYLAACVFYETLFHKPVTGATKLSLDASQANTLQQIAQETVFPK